MEIVEAIILRVNDFDERDGFVTALLADGRVMNLYAMGIQAPESKNRLNLIPYSVVELEYFQNKDRFKGKLMRSTTLLENTAKDLRDLNLLAGMSALLEHREVAGTNIFKLFKYIVTEMEFKAINPALMFHFMAQVLKLENIRVKVDRCAVCGRDHDIVSFDLGSNGLLCKEHIRD